MASSQFLVGACVLLGVLRLSVGLKLRNETSGLAEAQDALRSEQLRSEQKACANQTPAADLVAGNLVYDFGFYNGADSRSYLTAGMTVVALEADPTLVAAAKTDPQMNAWMNSGQLRLVNNAIAPDGAPAGGAGWTKFYMNKCTQEWNSFYSSIGCRSCTPPHVEVPANLRSVTCNEVPVQATTCAAILQQYGVPQYFKLDIEGAESGCYAALKLLPEMVRPVFISGEVSDVSNIETFHNLGYKSYKLVQQKSGVTGPFGSNAVDCRTGAQWRSYLGAKAELHAMLSKPAVPGDVCPGSLVGGVWYDLHASRGIPQAW